MTGAAIYDDDGVYVCLQWEVALMARNRKSKRTRQKVVKVLARTKEAAFGTAERKVKNSGSHPLARVGARPVGVGLAFHRDSPEVSYDQAQRETLWEAEPQNPKNQQNHLA